MIKSHISYSELKIWAQCPFKHKLMYIDKIKGFIGNEYTAFGGAIHSLCENAVVGKIDEDEYQEYFQAAFRQELKKINVTKPNLVMEMISQADKISPEIVPALNGYFGTDFRVVSVEEQLYQNIDEFMPKEINFKGFVDLVLQTADGKYHVIDWKSCSWGWDAKKRSDKMITYQLTLYKKFFCEKHNIDPSLVETHFALLKRTSKKNHVEIFRVTSGSKKTENATNLLTRALTHICKQNNIKNRLSCKGCEFYKTDNCP
jgi:hypothetical protein